MGNRHVPTKCLALGKWDEPGIYIYIEREREREREIANILNLHQWTFNLIITKILI
jgi:hypothetical protein